MTTIAIAYHSGYGHTEVLAQKVAEGIRDAGQTPVLLKIDSARLLEVWKKGPLPFTEKAALEWQAQVLKNGLDLLERYPGNSDVHMALNQWLSKVTATAANQPTDGAITVATDPAQLRNDVQQAIDSLLTRQG